MHLFTNLLLLSVLALAPLRAFEFRVLSWHGEISGLRYQNGPRAAEIDSADERFFSHSYALAETPSVLELFRQIERDGEIVRQTVASIPVPAGLTQGILVLAPADAARNRYSGFWINDSPGARAANHIQIYNLSTRSVALGIDKENFSLAPRDHHQVAFDAEARSIPLKLAVQAGAEWQLVSARRQAVRSGYRLLILLRDGRPAESEAGTSVPPPVDIVTLYDRPVVVLASR